MMDKSNKAKMFQELNPYDKDLTMFRITDLTLTNSMDTNMVFMTLKLKRKIEEQVS